MRGIVGRRVGLCFLSLALFLVPSWAGPVGPQSGTGLSVKKAPPSPLKPDVATMTGQGLQKPGLPDSPGSKIGGKGDKDDLDKHKKPGLPDSLGSKIGGQAPSGKKVGPAAVTITATNRTPTALKFSAILESGPGKKSKRLAPPINGEIPAGGAHKIEFKCPDADLLADDAVYVITINRVKQKAVVLTYKLGTQGKGVLITPEMLK
jgi:hypothetical protein